MPRPPIRLDRDGVEGAARGNRACMAPPFFRPAESARSNAFPSVTAALCAAFVVGLLLAADAAGDFRANPAFRHNVMLERGLHSSIADIEVHTKMKSFPPMSLTFHGHSYFRAPDKMAASDGVT